MDLTDKGSWETWVVHKELADQAFRQGQHSLAVAEYTQAINRCTGQSSDRAKLFANRGLACQRAGAHMYRGRGAVGHWLLISSRPHREHLIHFN